MAFQYAFVVDDILYATKRKDTTIERSVTTIKICEANTSLRTDLGKTKFSAGSVERLAGSSAAMFKAKGGLRGGRRGSASNLKAMLNRPVGPNATICRSERPQPTPMVPHE